LIVFGRQLTDGGAHDFALLEEADSEQVTPTQTYINKNVGVNKWSPVDAASFGASAARTVRLGTRQRRRRRGPAVDVFVIVVGPVRQTTAYSPKPSTIRPIGEQRTMRAV
jgi:hypothetical protein